MTLAHAVPNPNHSFTHVLGHGLVSPKVKRSHYTFCFALCSNISNFSSSSNNAIAKPPSDLHQCGHEAGTASIRHHRRREQHYTPEHRPSPPRPSRFPQ